MISLLFWSLVIDINYGFSINVICGKLAEEKMEKIVRIKRLEKRRYILHYRCESAFLFLNGGSLEITRTTVYLTVCFEKFQILI